MYEAPRENRCFSRVRERPGAQVGVLGLLLEEGGAPLLTHVVVRVLKVYPHLHVLLLQLRTGRQTSPRLHRATLPPPP